MSKLAAFLKRNSVVGADVLPLVQTMPALDLLTSTETDTLEAHQCDVFKNEKLNYFFVGRPAYKVASTSEDPAEWELPCCFIFDFTHIKRVRRVFPFDSGAHYERRYPSYINSMKMKNFEVSKVVDAPHRIIGSIFGSTRDYFLLKPKSRQDFEREFSLGVKDAHIKALHRLATHTAPQNFDDRRLTIEVQHVGDIDLRVVKPIAVVLPTVYLDDDDIRKKIEQWGSEPITYPIFSLSVTSYYGLIYEAILKFYEGRGFL